ncbi:Flp pilus assembly complex ATPase component TadA [Paraburkholderia edwinii]|uniref:Flp pilus assembly complex ATPase component TadA n=1 Tax=Paraburkholderia edwinii TaxID=2861782 RepID=A0ABX8UVQ6_9BURK|nr:ATPase, T2SS/T4P/T4SS family [Paraburkholderia edwinii]QYD72397.1 Flp pilus assembly complex ATPase component TadA [Paraburkholderia edwinii]
MLKLQIHTRNAPVRTIEIEQSCTIGKSPDCDVVVKGMLIGKVHARLVREYHAWYLEDHGGIVATLVNGSPVVRYGPLGETDQIEIGTTVIRIGPVTRSTAAASKAGTKPTGSAPLAEDDATLAEARVPVAGCDVQPAAHPQARPAVAAEQTGMYALLTDGQMTRPVLAINGALSIDARDSTRDATEAQENGLVHRTPSYEPGVPRASQIPTPQPYAPHTQVFPRPDVTHAGAAAFSSDPEASTEQLVNAPSREPINSAAGVELRKLAHMKVIAALDLRRLNVSRMADEELRTTVGAALDEILANDATFRRADIDAGTLKKSVFDEIIGLGPLEELLADPGISEIMVNCHDEIFVEQDGRLARSPVIFTDDRAVLGAIERIVAPIGRRIDESSPMVDARLKDGSRVNAVIPPLALKGPSITIRKFSRRKLNGTDLIAFGSMSADMLEFLQTAVQQRANIVISGGTGSGKTTLLNVLSGYIPDDERIVTVEDAAELQLSQPNLVSLEARPANMEGKGAIPIRDLVKNCLRMRPDRIVVGECRGGEALDMLQAMNTGHDGSLTTAHANSPRDCIARLEVMTLMAGLDLPVQAIREQVCSAVDIIVQQSRFSCGSRRVTHVTEVSGMESGVIQLQDVFVFRETGFGANGRIQGDFVPTAYIPDFYQDLLRRSIAVNTDIFTRSE